MKNRLLILVLLALPAVSISQVGPEAQKRAMEEYRQQYRQQFQEYKDTIHGQFIQYLQHRWVEKQVFQGQQQPLRPEPVRQPQSDSMPDTIRSEELPAGDAVTLQVGQYQPPVTDKAATYVAEIFVVPFYGKQLTFKIPAQVSKIKLAGIRERQVSDYWQSLNNEKMSQVTLQLARRKQEMRLNGWGLYDLTRHLAHSLYPGNASQQAALSVYLLNEMHYDVRMGRVGGGLVTLMSASGNLYGIPYTMIDSRRYYTTSSLGPTTA